MTGGSATPGEPPAYALADHSHTVNIESDDRVIEFPAPDPARGSGVLRALACIALALAIMIEVAVLYGIVINAVWRWPW